MTWSGLNIAMHVFMQGNVVHAISIDEDRSKGSGFDLEQLNRHFAPSNGCHEISLQFVGIA